MLRAVKWVTGTVVEGDDGRDDDEDEKRDVGADSACVLEPFADVEADDVEADGDDEQAEGDFEEKGTVLREGGAARSEDVGGHGGRGEEQAGK